VTDDEERNGVGGSSYVNTNLTSSDTTHIYSGLSVDIFSYPLHVRVNYSHVCDGSCY